MTLESFFEIENEVKEIIGNSFCKAIEKNSSDFIESEEEFLEYLDMHKIIYSNHSTFIDEVDLLNGFVNHDLAKKVKPGKPLIIRCGSYEIDEEYAQEYRVPFDHLEDELEMMKEERI